ncbi:MAG: 16S rRNA (guanine(527)-N(7))-methyltransferase RsmG [Ruminococcus sp.]|nr:16S rRNA (guanine(527)-N(7))-methyltransferase RsmG [Ruminococcus sp.]
MLERSVTRELFSQNGIELDDAQLERLEKYSTLLVEKNKVVNLTAITDDEGVTVKHFFDSIYPFTLFDVPENVSVIDVGTGAGFPSCPLKVFRGDIQLTLLDSLNKRIKFLEELSQLIALDARCIHSRAEDGGRRQDLREHFDIATARAVAELEKLCEYCLPFVKVGGLFAALKGSGGEEELEAAKPIIKQLGGKCEKLIKYSLPNGDPRQLILIRKLSATPPKFPRTPAQLKKAAAKQSK